MVIHRQKAHNDDPRRTFVDLLGEISSEQQYVSMDVVLDRLETKWASSLYRASICHVNGFSFMHIDRLSRGVLTDVIGMVPRVSSVKVLANLDRFEEVVEW